MKLKSSSVDIAVDAADLDPLLWRESTLSLEGALKVGGGGGTIRIPPSPSEAIDPPAWMVIALHLQGDLSTTPAFRGCYWVVFCEYQVQLCCGT